MFDFESAFASAIVSRSVLILALLDGTVGWTFWHSVRAAEIGYHAGFANR
jgi:hypothetical protein